MRANINNSNKQTDLKTLSLLIKFIFGLSLTGRYAVAWHPRAKRVYALYISTIYNRKLSLRQTKNVLKAKVKNLPLPRAQALHACFIKIYTNTKNFYNLHYIFIFSLTGFMKIYGDFNIDLSKETYSNADCLVFNFNAFLPIS